MNNDQKYMLQCLELAKKGFGNVTPNPMVGCVIIHQGKVIGKGYHEQYGKAHAEVNAINSIKDLSLLKESTLYVNLEPCVHFGKTPPCSDLIIKHQIHKVVIGCIDSYSEVSGKGIEKMRTDGIEVIVGILEKEAIELNKRFFTFHNKKRPYIILKWAQTQDGFIDIPRHCEERSNPKNEREIKSTDCFIPHNDDNWITTPTSKKLVHQWRSEEQAIMVGTNTAINDNPELTVRKVIGKNPLRIVLDLNLRLLHHLHLFDQSTPTLVFNYHKNEKSNNLEFVKLKAKNDLLEQVIEQLYKREIQSVIIEGGAQLLTTFILQNFWDEARVFIGEKQFKNGLKAPKINAMPSTTKQIETDTLNSYFND